MQWYFYHWHGFEAVFWGLGEDQKDVDPRRVQLLLKVFNQSQKWWDYSLTNCVSFKKGMITGQILWICSNTMVRVSIVLLYLDIFRSPVFHLFCYSVLQLNATYFIAVMVQTFLICKPFSFNWNPTLPGGSCGNVKIADRSIGVLNFIFDLILVFLPLPMVWKLQMP